MLEKIPFGQTPEQRQEAEGVLRGSDLELEVPGQFYDTRSKKEVENIVARTETEEELLSAEKKLKGSDLELEDPGQFYGAKSKGIKDINILTEEVLSVAEDKVSKSELKDVTLENKDI